ncbi:hypothetical protein J8F10_08650 [Gemmata sp. G18]|uniref:Transposase n=1 Tax=Gemmata palustris TaxID=2822762 RepID=A0ABS5BPG8_9BACT|nr:hypothetical protein [Gemmata palustris]MBP3955347.1 hypothetical protein [Gemmata palustris]
MSVPKVFPQDYIDFLIATPKGYSVRRQLGYNRANPTRRPTMRLPVCSRVEPDPDTLWAEARTQVRRDDGVLVVDDSTLDKPYARAIELVTRHWSGKHHAVVRGST